MKFFTNSPIAQAKRLLGSVLLLTLSASVCAAETYTAQYQCGNAIRTFVNDYRNGDFRYWNLSVSSYDIRTCSHTFDVDSDEQAIERAEDGIWSGESVRIYAEDIRGNGGTRTFFVRVPFQSISWVRDSSDNLICGDNSGVSCTPNGDQQAQERAREEGLLAAQRLAEWNSPRAVQERREEADRCAEVQLQHEQARANGQDPNALPDGPCPP